jgi:RNA-directed DNA polymerase
LGIPTVADRIAQEVARRYLEPVFHPDSFDFRPGKSAIDAMAKVCEHCWRHDWVLDPDIKGFFISSDWELLLKSVRQYTDCAWVLLYITDAGATDGLLRRSPSRQSRERNGIRSLRKSPSLG